MEKMSTSSERVDNLMQLSDRIYPVIDERISGETRAHQTIRLQVNAIAQELQTGSIESAGDITESILADQLGRSGLFLTAYEKFPSYALRVPSLSDPPQTRSMQLNELANQYARTPRATLDATGEREQDARHAVHVTALALAYAAEFYPHLDLRKIAVYGALHDILEAYVGDVSTYTISPEELAKKHKNEMNALGILAVEYGYTWPAFVKVIQNYEALQDEEARFVKTFDKLDPAFTHYTNKGQQIVHYHGTRTKAAMLENMHKRTEQIALYGTDFPLVMEDRIELTQRVADHIEWPATDTVIV